MSKYVLAHFSSFYWQRGSNPHRCNHGRSPSLQRTCQCIPDIWPWDYASPLLYVSLFPTSDSPRWDEEGEKKELGCTSSQTSLPFITARSLNWNWMCWNSIREPGCVHITQPPSPRPRTARETDRDREAGVNHINPAWESLSGYQTPELCVCGGGVCVFAQKRKNDEYSSLKILVMHKALTHARTHVHALAGVLSRQTHCCLP